MDAIAERLQWWDELFEPPCIGFAASREEAAEFASAGADFVLVGDFIWADPRGAKESAVDHFATLTLPEMAATVTPLVYAVPVQLMAYHTAVALGTDVDQPRNLAKSVTVE